MSQPRFPDPARSRALLIGASHFTIAGPDLPDIPAVEANLTTLRQVLTSPDTGVLRPEFCRMLIDPTSADEVGTALSDLAATATDLLLVYYAGHGLVDDRGRLHLALAHTHPHRARWTALPLELLREEIVTSVAPTRVLVLDCCFSGRAIETMADNQGVISGQLDVAGTYTLTSTTANAPSHAPAGDRYTAFTGALLNALDETDPLTLDQIYVTVDRDLAARNLPRPQRRAVNAAGDLALSRGSTATPRTEQLDSNVSQFTWTYPVATSRLLVFRTVLLAVILIFALYFFFLPSIGSIIGLVGALLTLVSLITTRKNDDLHRVLLVAFPPSGDNLYTHGLVVDRCGLTIQRPDARIHLPWLDIAQVGVLQPERGSLNQHLRVAKYEQKPVLVVRLRPEIPAPSAVSLLSDEHRQLGYLGLCTLGSLGSSLVEMTSALERFAGGKLLHGPRQFLDRDPRLRPDMV